MLIQRLIDLPVDAYLEHAGVIVARLSEHKYIVLRDRTVTAFGGRREDVRYLASRVAECVTGERITPLCARCGQRERYGKRAYCIECNREVSREWYRNHAA